MTSMECVACTTKNVGNIGNCFMCGTKKTVLNLSTKSIEHECEKKDRLHKINIDLLHILYEIDNKEFYRLSEKASDKRIQEISYLEQK